MDTIFEATEVIGSLSGEGPIPASPRVPLQLPPLNVERVRELAAQGIGSPTIARMLGTTRGRVDHVMLMHRIPRRGTAGPDRLVLPPKTCQQCGRLFERRQNEQGRDFRDRRFCSLTCSSHYRVAVSVEKWADEDIARLREMAAEGMSARQIGNVLGCTRNAIVGLARRNHIKLGGYDGLRYGPAKPPPTTRRRPRRPQKLHANAPPIEDANIPLEQRVTFLDLAPHHCRWPIGDAPKLMFCGGERAKGSPYCASHHTRAHKIAPSTRPAATYTLESGLTTKRRRLNAMLSWHKHKQQRVGI